MKLAPACYTLAGNDRVPTFVAATCLRPAMIPFSVERGHKFLSTKPPLVDVTHVTGDPISLLKQTISGLMFEMDASYLDRRSVWR